VSDGLIIRFSGHLAEKIKDVARAQGVTYASLCRCALMHMVMADGRHVVMRPFGQADFEDCSVVAEKKPRAETQSEGQTEGRTE